MTAAGRPGLQVPSRLAAQRGLMFSTWPPRRQPALRRAVLAGLGELATGIAGQKVLELSPYPEGVTTIFDTAVAAGKAKDSPIEFRRIASESFGAWQKLAAGKSDPTVIVINMERLRADPAGSLASLLVELAPQLETDPRARRQATNRALRFLPDLAPPDPSTFRHFDPDLFDLLGKLSLPRKAVEKVFKAVLDRAPNEAGMLAFQTFASLAELRNSLNRSPEARILRHIRSGGQTFPSYDQVEAEVLLFPAFQAYETVRKTPIPWPTSQIFVSHKARVVYCPIGKVACTFLKQQMVTISDVAHAETIKSSVHLLTDHVVTGLQLSDYPLAEAQRLLENPDYLRFAVVRHPEERLLSAYIEKFVLGRREEANCFHTGPVVMAVQQAKGIDGPDFEAGITFREFITEICAQPVETLDPHWIPQAEYLKGVAWDRIWPLERLDRVVDFLESRSGMVLDRQPQNTTGSGLGVFMAGAADLSPAQIQSGPRLDRTSFFDDDLRRLVRRTFEQDYRLHEAAISEEEK